MAGFYPNLTKNINLQIQATPQKWLQMTQHTGMPQLHNTGGGVDDNRFLKRGKESKIPNYISLSGKIILQKWKQIKILKWIKVEKICYQ